AYRKQAAAIEEVPDVPARRVERHVRDQPGAACWNPGARLPARPRKHDARAAAPSSDIAPGPVVPHAFGNVAESGCAVRVVAGGPIAPALIVELRASHRGDFGNAGGGIHRKSVLRHAYAEVAIARAAVARRGEPGDALRIRLPHGLPMPGQVDEIDVLADAIA